MRTDALVSGEFNGVLFIGDPHVSSRKPGRRKDDYLSSVLGKLSEAADIARRRNLLPVITGDLIHREAEDSTELIHRLIRVLKSFHVPPVDVEGNHGKVQSRLGVGDIELLLHDTGLLRVVSGSQLFGDITVAGQRVQLFGCSHGDALPEDLASLGAVDTAMHILVTHHDLAFENDYPGALPLREVRNCDAAVNGHMHKTSPPVVAGTTTWHCPGNIEPLSIDVRDHRPAVWEMAVDPAVLTPHYLSHDQNCFNLTGLQVPALDGDAAVAALVGEELPEVPQFLAELQAQDSSNVERTDDASVFEEDVESVLRDSSASEATQSLMRALLTRVKARSSQ